MLGGAGGVWGGQRPTQDRFNESSVCVCVRAVPVGLLFLLPQETQEQEIGMQHTKGSATGSGKAFPGREAGKVGLGVLVPDVWEWWVVSEWLRLVVWGEKVGLACPFRNEAVK